MKAVNFPGCCAAVITMDFGETGNSLFGNEQVDPKLEEHLDMVIDLYGRYMIVATTNNEQIGVNALLEKKGFKRTPWMHKDMHPDTVVCMWWREPEYDTAWVMQHWEGRDALKT